MWTFEIATGRVLDKEGQELGHAYSGYDDGDGVPEPGEGKNDPAAQHLRGVGPIPVGMWVIGEPFFHPHAGPYVMRLTPVSGTETYGRSGFLIHGDSKAKPGSGSHGCIVMSREMRMKIWESGDHLLSVIPGRSTTERNIA